MTSSEPSRALIAYAALAHRLTMGGDVVQALMSFFRPIADEFSGEFFEAEKFCLRVLNHYGLLVPKLAAMGWCDRLVQEQLLEVVSRTGPTPVYRWKGKPISDVEAEVDAFQSKVDSLLVKFREKCEATLSPDFFTIATGNLESEFFERLLRLDSMRLLLKKDLPQSSVSSGKTLTIKPVVPTLEDRLAIQLDYIVADFILNLRDSSQTDFELISNILFANMAAEAVSTFRDPQVSSVLSGMRVYLDTPLILDMFRVNTGFENYADELWSLLKSSGAQIKVFDHTVQESESVVSARLAAIRSGQTHSSHSTTSGLRVETLAMLDHRIAQSLEARGVVIERDPETSLLKLSQRALGTVQSELDKKMQGWKRDAKYFDEKTVFSVIAIRSQMQVETSFSKARAVLLTRNTPLVVIANTAWRSWLEQATNESRSLIGRSAPIAISDKQFAGLVWLIGGAEKAAPLSRARIVAHCAAAIRPRADVVAKACSLVIDAHGSADGEKFAALMLDDRAEQAVMRLSSGDPASLTKDRLPELHKQAVLAAGEHAAKLEREKAELEKLAIVKDYDEAISAKVNEIGTVQANATFTIAQRDLELRNARRAAERLELREKSREIREACNKVSALEQGFTFGLSCFQNSRVLVALVYGLSFLVIGQVFIEHQLINALFSTILTLAGFWILPALLFNPICQKIATYYFQGYIQGELGRISDPYSPDFIRARFLQIELEKAEIERMEIELSTLRSSAID